MTPEQTARKLKSTREWQHRHRDKLRDDGKRKYAANPELYRAKARKWREHYRTHGPATTRTEKRCSGCKRIKAIVEFPKNSSSPDGRSSFCSPCNSLRCNRRRKENLEGYRAKARAYNARPEVKARERIRSKLRPRRHPTENTRNACRKWLAKNRDVARKATKAWHKFRCKTDEMYRFEQKTRAKIRLLLRGLRKSAPTESLLGCKIAEFRKYLESKWEPWMSSKNYGNRPGCWVIDHIVPVNAFDLSLPEHQRLCFHHTNHIPLCREKNQIKSDNYDPADMIALRARVLGTSKNETH